MTLTPVDPTDDLAVLKAARAWLDDPEHWTQGTYWRDAGGDACIEREDVASTCAEGAIPFVAGLELDEGLEFNDEFYYANSSLRTLASAMPDSPVRVNDGMGREAVLAGYDRAIATLEAERAA